MNKSVLGFVSGVGLDIPLSEKINILLDISYQLDLTNALKNETPIFYCGFKDGIYTNVSDAKNRSVLFSTGLYYKLK